MLEASINGKKAVATFADALIGYLKTAKREPTTLKYCERLLKHFGDTCLRDIDQAAVDRACEVILKADAAPATRKRGVIVPLQAIMRHGSRRGLCDSPDFEKPRDPSPKTDCLLPEQATALVREAAPHLKPIIVFALGVGCRASEALTVDWSSVDLEARRVVLNITKRTNGSLAHYVEMPPVVVEALRQLPHRKGAVFRTSLPAVKKNGDVTPLGGPFRGGASGGGQFKKAWSGAAARAGLPGAWKTYPNGQRHFSSEITPHDTRHTWASWHYEVHRDLLRLRDEGGWGTARMVERYAHRRPGLRAEAIRAWWNGDVDVGWARANSVQSGFRNLMKEA